MNTKTTETTVNGRAANKSANTIPEAAARKSRGVAKATPTNSYEPRNRSKKDQLAALISKPKGARISVLVERLGWQAHTVRAALSGMRKQGIEITTSKSPKTGETVYAIVAQPNGGSRQIDRAAS